MKMKHNKKRNTAFIYEAIIRELARAIHEGDAKKKSKLTKLIREGFKGGTLLSKDLDLYKSILETKGVDKYTAEKIIFQSKMQKQTIDHKRLFEEQSRLIESINKHVSPDVFSNFVPNYKDLATVFQIFHPKTKTKSRVLLENQMLGRMMGENIEKKSPMKPVDNLVYKTFVKKFNEKYSSSLISEQKELLSKFIGSFSDNGIELKVYLNEEIPRLLKVVLESREMKEIRTDSDMLDKTNRVIDILKESDKKKVDKDLVYDVLRIQNLVKELL
jgi:hypothetical protein